MNLWLFGVVPATVGLIILIIKALGLRAIEGKYKPHQVKYCSGCHSYYTMPTQRCTSWGCPKPLLEVQMTDPAPR